MAEKTNKFFDSELKVINIGLEIFKDAPEAQHVPVPQVEWTSRLNSGKSTMIYFQKYYKHAPNRKPINVSLRLLEE